MSRFLNCYELSCNENNYKNVLFAIVAAISVASTFIVVAANESTIAAPAHTQRLYAFGAVKIIAFTPKSAFAAGTNDNIFPGGSAGYEHGSNHP